MSRRQDGSNLDPSSSTPARAPAENTEQRKVLTQRVIALTGVPEARAKQPDITDLSRTRHEWSTEDHLPNTQGPGPDSKASVHTVLGIEPLPLASDPSSASLAPTTNPARTSDRHSTTGQPPALDTKASAGAARRSTSGQAPALEGRVSTDAASSARHSVPGEQPTAPTQSGADALRLSGQRSASEQTAALDAVVGSDALRASGQRNASGQVPILDPRSSADAMLASRQRLSGEHAAASSGNPGTDALRASGQRSASGQLPGRDLAVTSDAEWATYSSISMRPLDESQLPARLLAATRDEPITQQYTPAPSAAGVALGTNLSGFATMDGSLLITGEQDPSSATAQPREPSAASSEASATEPPKAQPPSPVTIVPPKMLLVPVSLVWAALFVFALWAIALTTLSIATIMRGHLFDPRNPTAAPTLQSRSQITDPR